MAKTEGSTQPAPAEKPRGRYVSDVVVLKNGKHINRDPKEVLWRVERLSLVELRDKNAPSLDPAVEKLWNSTRSADRLW
jgi:hypothetical protein